MWAHGLSEIMAAIHRPIRVRISENTHYRVHLPDPDTGEREKGECYGYTVPTMYSKEIYPLFRERYVNFMLAYELLEQRFADAHIADNIQKDMMKWGE